MNSYEETEEEFEARQRGWSDADIDADRLYRAAAQAHAGVGAVTEARLQRPTIDRFRELFPSEYATDYRLPAALAGIPLVVDPEMPPNMLELRDATDRVVARIYLGRGEQTP